MQTIFATRRESLDTLLYTQTSDPANEVQATASDTRLSKHKQLCFDDVDPSANAGLTQRPECDLYTVEVGGSNPSARTIPLTRGYSALVDPEDYERFAHRPWFALVTKGRVYAGCKLSRSTKTLLLHRMVLDAPDGVLVDHRDRNPLNCTRGNLRLCNSSQNAQNARHKMATTGFIGVRRNPTKRHASFSGIVALSGRRYYTRVFDCPVLAACARDVLAQKLHKEFAVLNFQIIPIQTAVAR